MTLPTKFDVILCEGVREEKRKKLTVFGFFAGDDVILDEDLELEKVNLKLVYVARFRDGHGKWPITWKVIDPNGEILSPEVDELPFEKREEGNSIYVVEFAGHGLKEYGDHRFVITIADKEYEFKYKIKPGKIEK